MGETNSPLVAHVGYDISPLSITGVRGTDLPPPFFQTFCLQINF